MTRASVTRASVTRASATRALVTRGPDVGWYLRRLRCMTPGEVAWRVGDQARRALWIRRQVRPDDRREGRSAAGAGPAARVARHFPTTLPPGAALHVPPEARAALVRTADELLAGRWEVLGVVRDDLVDPDWFLDPVTRVRSDPAAYAFRLNHRSVATVGDVKQVWELSRHGHVTLLAAAWACTREPRYAERAAAHLRAWWAGNPFLSGIHWTSGIEVGLRLIAWTWARRLLDGWDGVTALFDANDLAHRQLGWHQQYLAAFRSRGSSANNHVVAEAAGLLVGSCAFPWFDRSTEWRTTAAAVLEREIALNTYDSGLNRELASEYHGFVGMLGLLAAVEAEAAGHPLGDHTWSRLVAMTDVAAALVDVAGRPPRQGDGDDGRAVLLDPPDVDGWATLLSVGAEVVGPLPWWPTTRATVTSTLVGALLPHGRRDRGGRPSRRPDHLADAGVTLLRTRSADAGPELWCRCDGGPHGFLGIAGHAHADALSLEVRHAGVDVLADPGTFSYRADDPWRAFSRCTAGHNTVEVAGVDQSLPGGPFLWTRHASTRIHRLDIAEDADVVGWSASHDGYSRLDPPVDHLRTVELDRVRRLVRIDDVLRSDGPHPLRIAFHLGPAVAARLEGSTAQLAWPCGSQQAEGVLDLPPDVRWTLRHGSTEPLTGWYAPRLGRRVPAAALVGEGTITGTTTLRTVLRFVEQVPGSPGITARPSSLYCW